MAIELEALAEFDVDAGKSTADRGGDGALQSDAGALDGFVQLFRNVLLVFLVGLGAGGEGFPIELEAGSFEDTNGGGGDFGADAVAGDERDFVCHAGSLQKV